jgi:hypothetical protein
MKKTKQDKMIIVYLMTRAYYPRTQPLKALCVTSSQSNQVDLRMKAQNMRGINHG